MPRSASARLHSKIVCNRDVLNSLRHGATVEVPTLARVVVFGRAESLAPCLAPCGHAFVSAVFTWCCTSKRRIFMSSPARRVSSCLPVVLHRVLEVPCVFRVCWCCHVSSYVVLSWSHGPVGPHVLVSGILSLRVFCWHCDSCLFLGSWL